MGFWQPDKAAAIRERHQNKVSSSSDGARHRPAAGVTFVEAQTRMEVPNTTMPPICISQP
ncbi:hypothetical protein DMH17_05780 [Raoultella planticola]|nr:hypothetical protein [Raoultella planticola]